MFTAFVRRLLPPLVASLSLLVLSASLAPHAQARANVTRSVTNCSNQSQLLALVSAATPGDTISFACSGKIVLTDMLQITKNLTLDGSGQQVTLSGGNLHRVLYIGDSTHHNILFTLRGLTIANGYPQLSYAGGGLYNEAGIVSIVNSVFINNQVKRQPPSLSQGGALYNGNAGIAVIGNSAFINNQSVDNGGALFNSPNSQLSIANSTFAANTASHGAAIYNDLASASIANSTFATNTASFGAGIYNSNATTTITNSTFANNTATNSGAAIFNEMKSVSLGATIVANNTGSNCAGLPITSQGYNLENAASCGFTKSTDKRNTNPKLDPKGLQNNGGPTQTIALLPLSPAISQVRTASLCPKTDQRSLSRKSPCDIGAYESQLKPA